MTKHLTMSDICAELGLSPQTVRSLARRDPLFPAEQFGKGGHFRCQKAALDVWKAKKREERNTRWARQAPADAITTAPDHILVADAADDFRSIMRYGAEPDTHYWTLARRHLTGDIPPDLAAGFGLSTNASWAAVHERAERLIGLPAHEKAKALSFVKRRVDEFFATARDALTVDEALA